MYLKLKTFLIILNKNTKSKINEIKYKNINEYEKIKTNNKIIDTNNISSDKYNEFITELELYNMYHLV
jgi:hypothetical protein